MPTSNIKSLLTYTLFLEAWLLLALARAILILIPFRKITPLMGETISANDNINTNNTPSILHEISLAIKRAAKRSPWRTMCFEQALAAKIMLRRRKLTSTIYFGIHKNAEQPKQLMAHAWIECHGMIVTGGKNIESFTVINRFRS